MRYHKNKHHASILNPPTAAVGDKCDEVDSKASIGKEQTRNSREQNALFDEPMLRNGSIEENLPTSVPSVEPKVQDHTVEVQDAVELPTSIPSVEPNVHNRENRKTTRMIQREKMRTSQIVKMMRHNLQRKEVFAAKLQNNRLLMIQVELRKCYT